MGVLVNDEDLYMREFTKSLTEQAYTWYVNLKPWWIHDLEHLGSLFNTKFFCTEAKSTLVEHNRSRRSPRRLHEEIPRESFRLLRSGCWGYLRDVCLYGMIEDYWINLENLSSSSFYRLLRRTNESIINTLRSSSLIRSARKKSQWWHCEKE